MIARGAQAGVSIGYGLFTRYFFLLITPLSLAAALVEFGATQPLYAIVRGLCAAAFLGVLSSSAACLLSLALGALLGMLLRLVRLSPAAAALLGGALVLLLVGPLCWIAWQRWVVVEPFWYILWVIVPAVLLIYVGGRAGLELRDDAPAR